jgi:hypothetical protein
MQPLTRVRRATKRRTQANDEWVQAILDAHAAGDSLRAIANAANVTNPRIHQIVSGRRWSAPAGIPVEKQW